MTLEEKLAEFLTTGRLPATPVAVADLEKIGIDRHGNLANCYFEPSVNLESQVFSRARSCFIGAHSYMNSGGYLRSDVFIGRYCSIGRRVSIAAGNHPFFGLGTHPLLVYGRGRDYSEAEREALNIRPERPKHTIIGNDVWIGDGAVVLPGVTIGTGAVVGANTVVTRDVPEHAVVAGTPGRVLRLRFPEELSSRILATCWWNHPIEKIRSFPVKNVFEFIEFFDCGDLPTGIETHTIQN